MTTQEFETIALAIKAAYPNSNVLPDKYAMKVWYQLLSDLDVKIVENAILEHISISRFPPSIAEIREKSMERVNPIITEWSEAWQEVIHAMRFFGSYRVVEALASLSPLTCKAVKRMGFLNLCQSENPVADRAHFQRIYECMAREEKKKIQPSINIQQVKKQITRNVQPKEQIENKSNMQVIKQNNISQYTQGKINDFYNAMGKV